MLAASAVSYYRLARAGAALDAALQELDRWAEKLRQALGRPGPG